MGAGKATRTTIVTAVTAVLAFPLGGTASAQETLAAECAPPRAGHLQNSTANDRFAMTFVPSQAGAITRAEIDYQEPPGHQFPLRVQILATDPGTGAPTDAVLAETSVADPLPGPTTLVALFPSPAAVTAGQSYGLALSRPGAGAAAFGWGFGADPNACQGGFFVQAGGSGAWDGSRPYDMIFRAFMLVAAADEAPDTVISKGPRDKTRRRTATFEFTGTDARSVAGFECSVDGAPFATCTSPHTVRVKKGRHTFQVRALDQAGNADGTPASDRWRVKRKKKR